MSYALTNTVKDIQTSLRECGFLTLPTDTVDGLWGRRSSVELDRLLRAHAWYSSGRESDSVDVSELSKSSQFTEVIKALQAHFKKFGLYGGSIDGIWGRGSRLGLHKLVIEYQTISRIRGYEPAWSKLVSSEFYNRVKEWCWNKGFYPGSENGLMACMHFESGGTFDPSIQNLGGSYYFGLIQFGKMACKDLGVDIEDVRRMGQLEQLELVFKYFDMWERRGKRITQLEDFYLTILYPAAVGRKADQTLFEKGTKVYHQNRGFDKNQDGRITIGEIASTLYDTYYKGMDPSNRIKVTNPESTEE